MPSYVYYIFRLEKWFWRFRRWKYVRKLYTKPALTDYVNRNVYSGTYKICPVIFTHDGEFMDKFEKKHKIIH